MAASASLKVINKILLKILFFFHGKNIENNIAHFNSNNFRAILKIYIEPCERNRGNHKNIAIAVSKSEV